MRVLCAIALLLFGGLGDAMAAAERPRPLIAPGYEPGSDAKMDERGIWMEMQEAEQKLRRSPLLVTDSSLNRYVEEVACQVAGDYCGDLRVYVVQNPSFNASMAPNGAMLVFTGLLIRIISTDQLAAVLGHELAHYTQTHSIKRWRAIKNRMTAGLVVTMGMAAGGVNSYDLPQLFALTSVMGFSREQESEADILGAYFLNDAGYQPESAATIWLMLEAEEQKASVKYPKGPFFLSSHPRPENRAQSLSELAAELDVQSLQIPPQIDGDDPLVGIIQENYSELMDAQVQQRDYGRLLSLLERHEHLGIRRSDTAFYTGEAWRIRGGAGDHEHAIENYREAVAADQPNPRAYRELGYLLYKHGQAEEATEQFRSYLEMVPDASDREMIEMYMAGEW